MAHLRADLQIVRRYRAIAFGRAKSVHVIQSNQASNDFAPGQLHNHCLHQLDFTVFICLLTLIAIKTFLPHVQLHSSV